MLVLVSSLALAPVSENMARGLRQLASSQCWCYWDSWQRNGKYWRQYHQCHQYPMQGYQCYYHQCHWLETFFVSCRPHNAGDIRSRTPVTCKNSDASITSVTGIGVKNIGASITTVTSITDIGTSVRKYSLSASQCSCHIVQLFIIPLFIYILRNSVLTTNEPFSSYNLLL